jgi:Helix-turn-helix domain
MAPTSDTPATRLRAARAKRYPSASEAARAHGWHIATFTHHENGTRTFGRDDAIKYAHAFGVEAAHLLMLAGEADTGDNDQHVPQAELHALEDLVATLQAVRKQAGATDPPDLNLVRAVFTMVDAVVAQVAKLRNVRQS